MWLNLTRLSGADGLPVHVNMQLVTDMWRITDATEIVFGKEAAILVMETPEEIRARLADLASEPKPFVDRV
jgi:hypothetical protein